MVIESLQGNTEEGKGSASIVDLKIIVSFQTDQKLEFLYVIYEKTRT